jgi:hypothetical protein
LLDGIPDTPGGGQSSVTVTLPDVECERCTLQVIQVMDDKPPYMVPGNDIYYQCADLVLRRAAPSTCAGDCNGDGQVSVDELIAAVRILLGTGAVEGCRACDADSSGDVTVDEIIHAVGSALRGCGASSSVTWPGRPAPEGRARAGARTDTVRTAGVAGR